mmetsp:Transcript_31359/g.87961  ORF Transcript_31359/g.87961 Transcript_31359/m.87961 type:complete len:288 (-) Transcript_31359:65-928(-)
MWNTTHIQTGPLMYHLGHKENLVAHSIEESRCLVVYVGVEHGRLVPLSLISVKYAVHDTRVDDLVCGVQGDVELVAHVVNFNIPKELFEQLFHSMALLGGNRSHTQNFFMTNELNCRAKFFGSALVRKLVETNKNDIVSLFLEDVLCGELKAALPGKRSDDCALFEVRAHSLEGRVVRKRGKWDDYEISVCDGRLELGCHARWCADHGPSSIEFFDSILLLHTLAQPLRLVLVWRTDEQVNVFPLPKVGRHNVHTVSSPTYYNFLHSKLRQSPLAANFDYVFRVRSR